MLYDWKASVIRLMQTLSGPKKITIVNTKDKYATYPMKKL